MEKFLAHVRMTQALDTYKNKRWQLMPFMRWIFSGKRMYHNLTVQDIEGYLLKLDCCRAHKVNVAATIRQFYEYHGIRPNPAESVKVKGGRGSKLFQLPAAGRIVAAIDGISCSDPWVEMRDRLMVELAYGSGLRRGELMRLNAEDVNIAEQVAYVQGKGGTCRSVPVTGTACGLLKSYLAIRRNTAGPLFVNSHTGRRLSLNHISKIFKKRTGFKAHLYRHACATHLLKNGCNLRYVQELLGHRKINTTGIYTHLNTGNVRESVSAAHPRAQKLETVAA